MQFIETDEWEIIDEGVQEVYVYDIETENHMFFANDILVHNSCYVNPYGIYEKFFKNAHLNETERTDFYDKLCHIIEDKAITPTLIELTRSMNAMQNTLDMKREVICAGTAETGYAGFWVAKKRYALIVNDNEGLRYETPHMKVMGLSQIQSSTPKICRENLNEATRMMIEKGPEAVREYAAQVKADFMSKSPEEIALPRGVSHVFKYVDRDMPIKGTPVQSKAAIYHNKLVKELKLESSVDIIRDNDKIKFLYLKNNPYGFDVIGFHDKLPIEFNLHKYADKETHFEKAFKKPLSDMMEACNWDLVEKASIDEFF